MDNNLVQLGTDLWIRPALVGGVYQTNERPGGSSVYVIITNETPFGPSNIFRNTDWSLDRVQAALGLVSVNALPDPS